MFRSIWFAAAVFVVTISESQASMMLVKNGQSVATVVLSAQATEVARYAARELTYHVEKATGAQLNIVAEGGEPADTAGKIYLGPTSAARNAGIDPEKLLPDSFTLLTKDNALFIVGRDSEGNPLSPDTWAGTLFGVYEVLEQSMGVRWLWPGELGEHIPKTGAVMVPDLSKTVSPRLIIRRLRSTLRDWSGSNPEDSFSPEAMKQARADEAKWLRRQRMGHSRKMRWGHAFTDWWDKYGKDHPEWFNLLDDGKRHPQGGGGASAGMCVSSPGLHEQIVSNWLEECATSPDSKPNINGCENDVFGRCLCDVCKSWDPLRKDESAFPERFSQFGIVSDRYARFWRTLQEMAAKHDRDAIVTGYAYVNYAPPPVREKLNDHVWIGLVPRLVLPAHTGGAQAVHRHVAGVGSDRV